MIRIDVVLLKIVTVCNDKYPNDNNEMLKIETNEKNPLDSIDPRDIIGGLCTLCGGAHSALDLRFNEKHPAVYRYS